MEEDAPVTKSREGQDGSPSRSLVTLAPVFRGATVLARSQGRLAMIRGDRRPAWSRFDRGKVSSRVRRGFGNAPLPRAGGGEYASSGSHPGADDGEVHPKTLCGSPCYYGDRRLRKTPGRACRRARSSSRPWMAFAVLGRGGPGLRPRRSRRAKGVIPAPLVGVLPDRFSNLVDIRGIVAGQGSLPSRRRFNNKTPPPPQQQQQQPC